MVLFPILFRFYALYSCILLLLVSSYIHSSNVFFIAELYSVSLFVFAGEPVLLLASYHTPWCCKDINAAQEFAFNPTVFKTYTCNKAPVKYPLVNFCSRQPIEGALERGDN